VPRKASRKGLQCSENCVELNKKKTISAIFTLYLVCMSALNIRHLQYLYSWIVIIVLLIVEHDQSDRYLAHGVYWDNNPSKPIWDKCTTRLKSYTPLGQATITSYAIGWYNFRWRHIMHKKGLRTVYDCGNNYSPIRYICS